MTLPRNWNWLLYLLAGACMIAAFGIFPANKWFPDEILLVTIFGLTGLGMIFLVAAIGSSVTGSVFGILQSSRNTYGLSRFQMVIWTLIMLSGIAAAIAWRAWHGTGGLFTIPVQCLQVMGISYATGAAVPGLLALKSQSPSTEQQAQAASERMGETVVANGQIVTRPPDAQAVLADLVKGDDLATAGLVDLSKVQQLIVTCGLAAYYIYQLCSAFYANPAKLTQLPDFDPTFVQLLLVSHAGYLTYKAIPQSAPGTTSSPAGGAAAPRPPSPAP